MSEEPTSAVIYGAGLYHCKATEAARSIWPNATTYHTRRVAHNVFRITPGYDIAIPESIRPTAESAYVYSPELHPAMYALKDADALRALAVIVDVLDDLLKNKAERESKPKKKSVERMLILQGMSKAEHDIDRTQRDTAVLEIISAIRVLARHVYPEPDSACPPPKA